MIRRDGRGSQLIEMALIMVLLVVMLGGLTMLGSAMRYKIVIVNAAREGARYGSHFPHYASGIREATKQEAARNSRITLEDGDITIDPDPDFAGVAQHGDPIEVSVEYEFSAPGGDLIGIESITIRGAAEMVVFGLD